MCSDDLLWHTYCEYFGSLRLYIISYQGFRLCPIWDGKQRLPSLILQDFLAFWVFKSSIVLFVGIRIPSVTTISFELNLRYSKLLFSMNRNYAMDNCAGENAFILIFQKLLVPMIITKTLCSYKWNINCQNIRFKTTNVSFGNVSFSVWLQLIIMMLRSEPRNLVPSKLV